MKEEELIKKAQNGEVEAFGQIYDLYITKIYRFVFIKVNRKVDAEDIASQVFLNAWQHINNFQFQGFPFSSWLYKIASNAVIDFYRTQKHHENIDSVDADAISDTPETDKNLDQEFEIEIVKNALKKLEPDQQNLLIMKFIEDLPNKEIAEILGKTEGAVRVIQHRALKQLKKQLDESGHYSKTK